MQDKKAREHDEREAFSIKPAIDEMFAELENAPEIVRPSKFWIKLNRKHIKELERYGYDNFKRTLARNYFTWMPDSLWNPQTRFLMKSLPVTASLRALAGSLLPPKHEHIPLLRGIGLNCLTRLIWEYTRREAPAKIAALSEPEFGNPPKIRSRGRLISQDLANSILEYVSIEEVAARATTICELGGGYGRSAHVALSLHPAVKYILVDIPPALAVAQAYLQQVFPERRHFPFRPFSDFSAVKDEFERASIAFLLPHQIAYLPDENVDLFLNISSLHEMRPEQIKHFTDEIFRLVRPGGHFYLKAWRTSRIPFENIIVREEDYPLDQWGLVYRRTPKVHAKFFEALFRKPSN